MSKESSNKPTPPIESSQAATDLLARKKQKDSYGVGLVAAGLTVLALGVAGYWVYQDMEEIKPQQGGRKVTAGTKARKGEVSRPTARISSKKEPAMALPAAVVSTEPATVKTDVYFDFDTISLNEEAKRALKQQAESLRAAQGWKVSVQGFTDRIGHPAYNKALGLKRAFAVRDYLLEIGIPQSSIQVSSMGQQGGVCRERTEACRERNRRAHLHWSRTEATVAASLRAITPVESVPHEAVRRPIVASEARGETATDPVATAEASH